MPKVICSECQSIKDVESRPESTIDFVCSDCKKGDRSSSPQGRKRKKKKIPRKDHGTRVMLPITCAECGQTDTLDYVPKGADLDDVLCSECARDQFGTDSDWARIDRAKEKESGDKEWEFQCDECGRTDYLPFEPKDDRTYECNLCRLDHDTPSEDRLKDREVAAGGVFIRRNSDSDNAGDEAGDN